MDKEHVICDPEVLKDRIEALEAENTKLRGLFDDFQIALHLARAADADGRGEERFPAFIRVDWLRKVAAALGEKP